MASYIKYLKIVYEREFIIKVILKYFDASYKIVSIDICVLFLILTVFCYYLTLLGFKNLLTLTLMTSYGGKSNHYNMYCNDF